MASPIGRSLKRSREGVVFVLHQLVGLGEELLVGSFEIL
jgi:hypothetical protein